ncbi:hypothetical protein FMUND_13852 [Fusarium mundagurra]|uniref:NAD(+) ADP-ribosyltransferase n=1 Tax=Fusarium mundagurra TaxID=1567541 RepID=A0A8H6D3J5_9HYPO|nr:hypothetical protein FMUND_13852 [Fusarium mundagurra]
MYISKWNAAERFKDVLLLNSDYIEDSHDGWPCSSPYNSSLRKDCESEHDYGKLLELCLQGLLVMGDPERDWRVNRQRLDPGIYEQIPYLEFIVQERPSTMHNILLGLEHDPRLTVGCWSEREGLFTGKRVPFRKRRQADSKIDKVEYRQGRDLSLKSFCLDDVKAFKDQDIFICAVAKSMGWDRDFNLASQVSKHMTRPSMWNDVQTWPELLQANEVYIKSSREKRFRYPSPYLGVPRMDCQTDEEYRSLIQLTENGLLVLGGQGLDKGSDWRGGCLTRNQRMEYRGIPCIKFIVPETVPNLISNLLADKELLVVVTDGESGLTRPQTTELCDRMGRELQPGASWKAQLTTPEQSLEDLCLNRVKILRRQNVSICTVAMRITENNKEELEGEEAAFIKATTKFDLIDKIAAHIENPRNLDHAKNPCQLFKLYDTYIDRNFETENVEKSKMLLRNELLALEDRIEIREHRKGWKIPLLKFAFIQSLTKENFISKLFQDPKLAVGCWNGKDGSFRDMKMNTTCSTIYATFEQFRYNDRIEEEYARYYSEDCGTSLCGEVLEHVKALKDRDVIICIVAMRANKLIEDRDTGGLSKAIEKFDITKRVADHLEAVNSGATDVESTISRRRRATKSRRLLAKSATQELSQTTSRANPNGKQGKAKAGAGGKSRGNEKDQSKSPMKSRGLKKKDTECRHNAQNDPTYHVCVDPDSRQAYDACFVLTNSDKINKFYIIQVVKDPESREFWTRTRYGIVGKTGRTDIRGDGSLDEAVKRFKKKVNDKKHPARSNRTLGSEPDKYTIVERSYNLGPGGEEAIFSQNYDATKLPLGHLTGAAITKGSQCLQELDGLLDDPSLASTKYKSSEVIATRKLFNKYYS